MTVKAIALLRARPGMSREDFVRHYEESHAPLITRLFPDVIDYRRNYVDLDKFVSGPAGAAPDYDAVTELWYADMDAFDRAMTAMDDPHRGPAIAADEELFVDRDATRMFLVEERCSKIQPACLVDRTAFMRRYYDTYNAGDADRLAQFYAEDVVLTSAAGTIEGREALLDVYRGIVAGFDDVMTPRYILADETTAMVEIEDVLTARQDVSDFLGRAVRAGESIRLNLSGVYRFSGSRIDRITLYGR